MSNLSCSLASHCDSHCDISSQGNELLPLSSCSRDISAHLRQISVSQTSVSSEKGLILARVGLFDEGGRDFTICPKHRDQLGVKFKASIRCQHPLHGNRKGKRERGVNLRMSKEIKNKWNVVVPVGAGKLLCLFIFESSYSTNSYLDLFSRIISSITSRCSRKRRKSGLTNK